MWDAVRKIFSHDAAPEDDQTVPAPADAPTRAGSQTSESVQETTANAAAPSSAPSAAAGVTAPTAPSASDAVQVSPPGHAPQGLAAEPDAHHTVAAPSPPEEG